MKDNKMLRHGTFYESSSGESLEYVSIPSDVYSNKVVHRVGRSRHSHACIEMTYIVSGKATHTVIDQTTGEQRVEPLHRGCYYILDHNVSHMLSDVSQDFVLVNVLFVPSFLNASFSQYEPFDNVIKLVFTDLHLNLIDKFSINASYFDEKKELEDIFEKCWMTYVKREPGYRTLLRCYISEILIQTVKKQIPREKSRSHIIIDIRDYVNKNYMKNITLTNICSERFLNPSFISRRFRSLIGIPFETYLQNVRIQNACTLLTETDLPIDEVIERVGYADGASFRKHFKRILGTTPLQFRKLYK